MLRSRWPCPDHIGRRQPAEVAAGRERDTRRSAASMRADGSNLVDVMVEPETEMRPAWRGLTHAWAFVASVPAGAMLIIAADGVAATTAAAI